MRIDRLFVRYPYSAVAHYLFLGFCFSSCLSIAAAQIFIIAALVLWLAVSVGFIKAAPDSSDQFESSGQAERTLALIVASWIAVSMLAALVGIDPLHATPETFKSSIFLFLPFAVSSALRHANLSDRNLIRRLMTYLTMLVASQCIASIHTIISAAIGFEFPPRGPGPVTESGQLLLTLHCFICACFIASWSRSSDQRLRINIFGMAISPAVLSVGMLSLFLLIAWPQMAESVPALTVMVQAGFSALALLVLAGLFIPALIRRRQPGAAADRQNDGQLPMAFFSVAGALLVAAFVINLKRGPWLGFGFSLLLLGVLLARKRLIGAVIAGSFVLFLLGPAHQRIINFAADYEISGGRKSMWELGVELIERYPLGLGLGNASYMRIIDPSLPPQHRHMHNNLLNVAVETGLIGVVIYLTLMIYAVSLGIRLWNSAKSDKQPYVHSMALAVLSISCALLGWQIAGGVEYNFGDGEIRMIALLLVGLLVTIAGRLAQRVTVFQPPN